MIEMGKHRSLRERLECAAVSGAMAAMRATPDRLLMDFSERGLRTIEYPEGREFMKTAILLSKRNLRNMTPAVRRSVIGTLSKLLFKEENRRLEFKARNGFPPPIVLVVSPTMRCNLRCYGCYAGKYESQADLGLDTVDRVLGEAEEMGIYFAVISGGEPFILGDDLWDVIERHPGILFQVYTNGTLIDRAAARRLASIGNAYPCISVEGFEEETDARRGPGTFARVNRAMDYLREEGVFFGFSATATRENNELIVSEEFVDYWRRKGCVVGWYFHYVPVGREPGLELMPTPEQRIYRREEMVKRRASRDILLADFWNDGPLVGGCLAGGRYLHINSNGDAEPCVFAHFAVDNVRDKSLEEVLKSPLFTEIRKRQPFDENLFRPCMIIDLPEVLRDVVVVCGARPTHEGAEVVIQEFADDIDDYSDAYREMADALWREYH
jgi:MoaA/NifB/PqqE/SkfB family radical SAM enzyme